MKLKKVYRVLEFEQEHWMKSYIEMNKELEKKEKMISKRISTS